MSEVVKFLSDAGTFYVATVDGDKPKVRPFGIAIEHESKIYFVTGNQKEVYKQLQINPNFEVSATSKDGRWIRLKGKAVFENNIEVKKKAFEILPVLASLYNTPENPIFEVFYISKGEASIYSFTDAPKTLEV
ncbi:pyridoxamine 5'-phosphate oxidase family protein [Acetivibrio cellulolyticus]|uniref:pyridoxamine 5'-phosphate oxidase family protein n=1 Tax=Acetivibrio cellulolyticus TaxID=35830 RepID=UPI0001E2F077|nr:pyridoxamine 5'-phosphate oxidase family protein [Acetivibrio cellulolyticus]